MNKRLTLLFYSVLCLLVAACSDSENGSRLTSKAITAQLEGNDFKSIHFSKLAGNQWTKVCFLGPYNDNSAKLLGFDWQISKYTNVLSSDSHNVIIFATDTKIIEYVIHPRDKGDFSDVSGKCYSRESSSFIRDTTSNLVENNGSMDWKNYVPHKP